MASRGELERAVMSAVWDRPQGSTAQDVRAALEPARPAITTVLTVLNRLVGKGMVTRTENSRAHVYFPARGRDEVLSTLMADALGSAPSAGDRQAVLARFVGSMEASDAEELRRLMRTPPRSSKRPTTGPSDDPR